MRNNYTSTITNYNEKYSNFFSHVKEAVFEKKIHSTTKMHVSNCLESHNQLDCSKLMLLKQLDMKSECKIVPKHTLFSFNTPQSYA
jgi:hypothetical protein